MTATTARAEFLKTEERFATAVSAPVEARWGEAAADTSQSSPLVEEAAATIEAGRQLAQLGPNPVAFDAATLFGLHEGLEGRTVRLPYDGRFGMGATADMLVTHARVDRNQGLTMLRGFVKL